MSKLLKGQLKSTYEKRSSSRSDTPNAKSGGPPFSSLKNARGDKYAIIHALWCRRKTTVKRKREDYAQKG